MVEEVGRVVAQPAHWVEEVLRITEREGVELGEGGEVHQVLVKGMDGMECVHVVCMWCV